MALKGNLRDFSTTQLLNLINLARKTGTLTVEGSHAAQLAFREGKLIHATLGEPAANSLPTILQRAGKLTPRQSQAIQNNAGTTGDKQLGHLLIQAGYVTQSDIIQSVRSHVLDVVYKVFTWAEGLFRFDANKLPPGDRITIPIDLESVIMEGSRRLKEWEHLQAELPSLDISLKFADRPDARLSKINLTVEEWRVVSFINPRNSIRQIARANNLSDFQIRRIVFGLLQAGLVEVAYRPTAPRAEAPAGRRGAAGERSRPADETRSPAVKRSIVTRLIDRIRRL